MMPDRHRQPQQFLQDTVKMSGPIEVLTSSYQGYAIRCIVECRSKVIACRLILPNNHNITKFARIRNDCTSHRISPGKFADPLHGFVNIDPQGKGPFGVDRSLPTCAWVNWTFRTNPRPSRLNFRACTSAFVEHAHFNQRVRSLNVTFQSARLCWDFEPLKSQPFKVTAKLIDQFWSGSGSIDILDPQEEYPVLRCRKIM